MRPRRAASRPIPPRQAPACQSQRAKLNHPSPTKHRKGRRPKQRVGKATPRPVDGRGVAACSRCWAVRGMAELRCEAKRAQRTEPSALASFPRRHRETTFLPRHPVHGPGPGRVEETTLDRKDTRLTKHRASRRRRQRDQLQGDPGPPGLGADSWAALDEPGGRPQHL